MRLTGGPDDGDIRAPTTHSKRSRKVLSSFEIAPPGRMLRNKTTEHTETTEDSELVQGSVTFSFFQWLPLFQPFRSLVELEESLDLGGLEQTELPKPKLFVAEKSDRNPSKLDD